MQIGTQRQIPLAKAEDYFVHSQENTNVFNAMIFEPKGNNYICIGAGKLYAKPSAATGDIINKLIYGCDHIDIIQSNVLDEVWCAFRDKKVLVAEYIRFKKKDIMKFFEQSESTLIL